MTAKITNGLTHEEYSLLPGLNATAIKAGMHSMRRMHRTIKGQIVRKSDALTMGSIIHRAALEPDTVLTNIIVWEGGAKRGKAWLEFQSEHGGMDIISTAERDTLESALRGLRANKTAMRLIGETIHEQSVTWDDPVLGACKCRPDGLCQKYLLEVKTTAQPSESMFGQQFFRLGYAEQLGWYHDGVTRLELFPPDLPVKMIIIGTDGDGDCWVIDPVQDNIVKDGKESAREIAARYRACQAAGTFPGVTGGEDCGHLIVPKWMGGQVDVVPTEAMEACEL